ncbi:MAG: hypothetical protein LBK26_02930 [Rickettsiales bacterium]|jgi:hypothetical protein|nr:hypothetical protein [Rickettsiales bacterium]
MNQRNKSLSVLCALLTAHSIAPFDAMAAMRVGAPSRSYADAYQQIAMMRQIAEEESTANNSEQQAIDALPVRVASIDIAKDIIAGNAHFSANMETLARCAAIFPNGKFAWDRPNAGLRPISDSAPICVAEVEMRLLHGNTDIVLARAMVQSGDSIDCNISAFPESGYTNDAFSITFPADKEPTMDDVKRVMNAEQKQNAALKTAAAVLIGGGGMYFINKDNPDKWKDAAIGAGTAGAVTYTSTQIGKQAGDTLMAVGVNAAAGGLIANVTGLGGSVLMVKDCNQGSTGKCLWGMVRPSAALGKCVNGAYKSDAKDTAAATPDVFINFETETTYVCCGIACERKALVNWEIPQSNTNNKWFSVSEMRASTAWTANLNDNLRKCIGASGKLSNWAGFCSDGAEVYKINGAKEAKTAIPAAIISWDEKTFGTTYDDWNKFMKECRANKNSCNDRLYTRDASGAVKPANDKGSIIGDNNSGITEFHPIYLDASDGDLIDIHNKARLKTTAAGAAIGGALGGFSAYRGASEEIENRWVSAIQEYKDSLQKIYCATGTKWLGSYNDIIIIPNIIY